MNVFPEPDKTYEVGNEVVYEHHHPSTNLISDAYRWAMSFPYATAYWNQEEDILYLRIRK